MFVVPGDLVILESAAGNHSDMMRWCDSPHFEIGANSSTATVFRDLQNRVIGRRLSLSEPHHNNREFERDFREYVAATAYEIPKRHRHFRTRNEGAFRGRVLRGVPAARRSCAALPLSLSAGVPHRRAPRRNPPILSRCYVCFRWERREIA
jgi:hypothetical protein